MNDPWQTTNISMTVGMGMMGVVLALVGIAAAIAIPFFVSK